MTVYTETQLNELSRAELQQLAKQYHIKANAKNSTLIEQILQQSTTKSAPVHTPSHNKQHISSTTTPVQRNSVSKTKTPALKSPQPKTPKRKSKTPSKSLNTVTKSVSKKYTYKSVTPNPEQVKINKKRSRVSIESEQPKQKRARVESTIAAVPKSTTLTKQTSNKVLQPITNKLPAVPHNHIKPNLSKVAKKFNDTFTLKKLQKHGIVKPVNVLPKIVEGKNPLNATNGVLVLNLKNTTDTIPAKPTLFVNKSKTDKLAERFRAKQQQKLQQVKQMISK